MGYLITLKQLDYFLGAAVDEKTAAQKPKKSPNFGYPFSVFFIHLPDCKS
jgi:hypothetical protein